MKNGKARIAVILAFLCSLPALCLDLESEYKREIALYHVRPDQARSLKRDSNGSPVSEEQLEIAVQSLFDYLYPLDPSFLKRFKIKAVVFRDTVYDSAGRTYQHRMIGGDLYLDADLDDKQFYANMFYLQIPAMPRIYLNRWNNLNPDGFSYESTRGSLSGQAQKKLDAVLAEWDKYFVSRTGMYSTEMDMAMTFAYMVMNGPDATAFVRENSPTVQKKFELMCDILESVKAFEPGYMQTLLAEDLSQLKTYSRRALAVRLCYELTDRWNALEPVDEVDARFEKIAEMRRKRIDGPVEVAGRKVVPLVIALETKDMNLFRNLMQCGADPNVANEKKVGALMLAIANNEPEQVRLLLEAGANVTPEAARAGTASGVNAEIVKLMKSYLPGVRQMDAPEKTAEKKKKPGPAASNGGAEAGEFAGSVLYQRLNEVKFGRIELEDVNVVNVIQLLRAKNGELGLDGEGIRVSIPRKYAESSISIAADNISMYEILQLICKKNGLELMIEDPDKVILSGSSTKRTVPGNKSDSAKKKQ